MNPALPRRLDDVTPEWLGRRLARRYPGLVLRGFEVVETKNSHTTKLRLRLDLDDASRDLGIPEHVCVKANWSGLHTGRICEREARFYFVIADRLADSIAEAYFADWDGSGNGMVVMEDLARVPGSFGGSGDHLGIDAVGVGLESLARIHGAMWSDPELARWTWLPRSMDTDNDTEQVAQYWNFIAYNLNQPGYRDVVPAWVLERPETMHQALDGLADFELARRAPRTLVHGDAHQGNSFVRAGGQRVWLDWQLVRSGSPIRDVAYFITGSLTVEERRSADRELLRSYLDTLASVVGDRAISIDEAWDEFVRWPAYGTQAWLGNINAWGQAEGVEMVKRHFAACEDYDTVGLLTGHRRPRRVFVPGEGAYRLPRSLRQAEPPG